MNLLHCCPPPPPNASDGEVARVYSPYDNFFYNSKSPIQSTVKQHLVGSFHSFRTLKWYIRPHINSKNPSIHLSIVAARNCNSTAALSHLCMELWKTSAWIASIISLNLYAVVRVCLLYIFNYIYSRAKGSMDDGITRTPVH